MQTRITVLSRLTSFAAALACGLFATSSRAGDEREVIERPTRYPWHTAVKVDIHLKSGKLGRGSGMLIAPCTVLTNGHVVYDVSSREWRDIGAVHPGSYYEDGHTVDPYGARPAYDLATNTRYGDGDGDKFDYGAIFIERSFESEGITTYIPLVFGYRPSYVNMAGYPNSGLPSTADGSRHEQWHSFGEVDKIRSRLLYTDATSTGGASGAGVWVYSPTTGRRLVAINRAHNSEHDGIHVRLVRGNEEVITGWQRERCSVRSAAKGLEFNELVARRRTLAGDPIPLIPAATLRIVDAPARSSGVPVQRVSQVIENTYYQWEEYTVGAGAPDDGKEGAPATGQAGPALTPERYIRLLEPQQRPLTAAEAQVLLSASVLWEKAPRRPLKPVRSRPVNPTSSVYPNATGVEPADDPDDERSVDGPLRRRVRR